MFIGVASRNLNIGTFTVDFDGRFLGLFNWVLSSGR